MKPLKRHNLSASSWIISNFGTTADSISTPCTVAKKNNRRFPHKLLSSDNKLQILPIDNDLTADYYDFMRSERASTSTDADSYYCKEDFKSDDCFLRTQNWATKSVPRSLTVLSEHDYYKPRTSAENPVLHCAFTACNNNMHLIDNEDQNNFLMDGLSDEYALEIKTQAENGCKKCVSRTANGFSDLSTIVARQEAVSEKLTISESIGEVEPICQLCYCGLTTKRTLPSNSCKRILPRPTVQLPKVKKLKVARFHNNANSDIEFENSFHSLKDEMAKKGEEMNLAIKCIMELRSNGQRDRYDPKCRICNKLFSNSTNLIVHYRSHAQLKPFVCLLCRASFTRRHSLQYHMMCHNDEKLFNCPHCNTDFRHKSHFKDHMRQHTTNGSYFSCQMCNLKFGSRSSLRRHDVKAHKKPDRKIRSKVDL